MLLYADLHTHSRYARACSSNITIKAMRDQALKKGVNLLSAGDFTNKEWLNELKSNLIYEQEGFYKLSENDSIYFVYGTELATNFDDGGKQRAVHTVLLVSSYEIAEQIRDALIGKGDLENGRPELKISNEELLDIIFSIDANAIVIPAHIWTPYFGALGERSGFNSIEEAYGDKASKIFAIETGLSSDPLMNYYVSRLDRYTLLSNSDMHSLKNIGREANVFNIEPSFKALYAAIKSPIDKLIYTIEFYPEEGKYHYDGHRRCSYSVNPLETDDIICKICGKRLTYGVLHRVKDLSDRKDPNQRPSRIRYIHTVPLYQIISYVLRSSEYSKKVNELYDKLISTYGNEYKILLDVSIEQIASIDKEVAEAISNIRENKIKIDPGYDGVYGKLELLPYRAEGDRDSKSRSSSIKDKQRKLFDY